jgi:hypothetical protein
VETHPDSGSLILQFYITFCTVDFHEIERISFNYFDPFLVIIFHERAAMVYPLDRLRRGRFDNGCSLRHRLLGREGNVEFR